MKLFGIASLLSLGGGLVVAQAMDLQTLVDRSPFAPPGAGTSGTPVAEAGTLEFRGMVVDQAGTAYSVFDATANRGFWVREGENGPIRVKAYHPGDNLLEVDQGGRAVKLQLKRATIQAGAPIAVAPKPATNNNQGRPQAGAAPAAAPAADARRLEAVAAEVRRRRALRNAATPNQTAPATPPPPASP